MSVEYYKTSENRWDYLGLRYFKFNNISDNTVQVCVTTGDVKKGKSNTFGVYLIAKMTFLTNYYMQPYVEKCSKREYEKAFKKVIELLK